MDKGTQQRIPIRKKHNITFSHTYTKHDRLRQRRI